MGARERGSLCRAVARVPRTGHRSRPMSANGADVVIIGGGIIGCSIARLLRERNASVIVLERGEPARGATWAAGGMLSPLIESADDDPFFHLADRSFDLYPALVDSLQCETRINLDYRRTGKLQ